MAIKLKLDWKATTKVTNVDEKFKYWVFVKDLSLWSINVKVKSNKEYALVEGVNLLKDIKSEGIIVCCAFQKSLD